ncbi:MAG TPA: VCBS repeat-containing protein, partial [Planctomycetota bacterium]|nr:VCBS repeat-containing protein [Planctomycetota bacterium]
GDGQGGFPPLAEVEQGSGGFSIQGGTYPVVAGGGDINGDGRSDVLLGSVDYRALSSPSFGKAYVIFRKDDSSAVRLEDIERGDGGFVILPFDGNAGVLTSIALAGDQNGDGLDDVVVGASGVSPPERERAGSAFVIFGKVDTAPVELGDVREGRGGYAILGAARNHTIGGTIAQGGDVNGDGTPDLLLSTYYGTFGDRTAAGLTFVVFGGAKDVPVDLLDIHEGSGRGFVIGGAAPLHWSGTAISALGDFNGDGRDDIALRSNHTVEIGGRESDLYIVFGKEDGSPVDLLEVIGGQGGLPVYRGATKPGISSIAGAGDVNGDGYADLIFGVHEARLPESGPHGRAFVVFGGPDLESVDVLDFEQGNGGLALVGPRMVTKLGWSAASVGDVSSDGLDDFLVSTCA